MTIKLIQGDCLEVIPMLDVENIDAVITDPPYPDYHTDKWATTPTIDLLVSKGTISIGLYSNTYLGQKDRLWFNV